MPNSTFYHVSRQLQTNQSVSKGRISVTGLNARGGTPGLYETNGPGKSRKVKGDAARSAGRVDEPGSSYGRLFGRRQVVCVSVFFPHRALTLLRHQRITGLSSTMSNPPKYPRCLAQATSLPTRPRRGAASCVGLVEPGSGVLVFTQPFTPQGHDPLPAEHVCIYGLGMRSLRRARNLCHFFLISLRDQTSLVPNSTTRFHPVMMDHVSGVSMSSCRGSTPDMRRSGGTNRKGRPSRE